MKSIPLCLLVAVLTILAIACRKDKDPGPAPVNITGQPEDTTSKRLSAIINATAYAADTTTFTYLGNFGLHYITGTSQSGKELSIILSSLEPGVYELNPSTDNTIEYHNGANSFTTVLNGSGQLIITSATDTTISGTFSASLSSFESLEVLEITSGIFRRIPVVQ